MYMYMLSVLRRKRGFSADRQVVCYARDDCRSVAHRVRAHHSRQVTPAGASLGETASAVPTAGWKYLASHSVAFGGRKTAVRNGPFPVWQSPLASSLLPPRARPRGCEGPIRARGLQVCHHSGLANRSGASRRLPDGATTARGPLNWRRIAMRG